ncbi:MAG: hypothetical protein Kow0079_04840 [Vicingaceae bacterium]
MLVEQSGIKEIQNGSGRQGKHGGILEISACNDKQSTQHNVKFEVVDGIKFPHPGSLARGIALQND